MTEHGFLFKGEMVNAILADQKDQTRRILSARNSTVLGHSVSANSELWKSLDWSRVRVDQGPHALHPEASQYLHVGAPDDTWYRVRCRYSIGDRIWVKETHWVDGDDQAVVFYAATDKQPEDQNLRPSIFMERWMSRLTLEITGIRVQRVQEIIGWDVLAEGVDNGSSNPEMGKRWEAMQRMAFQRLWDSINSPRGLGWAVNPWVWAITFKRIT